MRARGRERESESEREREKKKERERERVLFGTFHNGGSRERLVWGGGRGMGRCLLPVLVVL